MRAGSVQGSAAVWAVLLVSVAAFLLLGCAGREEASTPAAEETGSGETSSEQPYAGREQRSIKALPDERVEDLLAGRGAGYAQAAELNHYPGPKHVLDLADELGLTAEQERAIEGVYSDMEGEVKPLGRELVDLEESLDVSFRDEGIDEGELDRLTGEIAAVERRLRAAHLGAHLELKEILDPDQVATYDRLRGYAGDGGGEAGDTSGHKGDHAK